MRNNNNNYEYAKQVNLIAEHLLCNQTHVVNKLLDSSKLLDLEACFKNMVEYHVKIHTDVFKVPEIKHGQELDKMSTQLQCLLSKKIQLLNGKPMDNQTLGEISKEIKDLEYLIKRYENAPHYPKQIFEWWLIPFWLSEKLIENDETMFRAYDCCWWGRTKPKRAVPLDHVLRKIVGESFS